MSNDQEVLALKAAVLQSLVALRIACEKYIQSEDVPMEWRFLEVLEKAANDSEYLRALEVAGIPKMSIRIKEIISGDLRDSKLIGELDNYADSQVSQQDSPPGM